MATSTSTLLSGRIVNFQGQPLEGLTIKALRTNSKSRKEIIGEARTEKDGNYVLFIFPEGNTNASNTPANEEILITIRIYDGEEMVGEKVDQEITKEELKITIDYNIDEKIKPWFHIAGTILFEKGSPATGLPVMAFDKDMRQEQSLGETTTDKFGNYMIRYQFAQITKAEKGSADLQIKVTLPGNQQPLTSPITFNAGMTEVIHLTIPTKKFKGPSEFENYIKILVPLIEITRMEDLSNEDLQFLPPESEIDSQYLKFLQLDAQYSIKYKVAPAVFYGLFRKGLSTNTQRLLAEKPSKWEQALKKSIDENIIPAILLGDVAKILDTLKREALNIAFEVSPDPKMEVPMGIILSTSGLTEALQKDFVAFSQQFEGNEEELLDKFSEQYKIPVREKEAIGFTLDTSNLVLQHVPTLRILQGRKKEQNWTSVKDLARLKRQDWEAMLVNEKDFPQGIKDEKEFAEIIALSVEQAFPTAIIAYGLQDDKELGTPDLNNFFLANPNFDLLHTPLNPFLDKEAKLVDIQNLKVLTNSLKGLHRLAKLTPPRQKYLTTSTLMKLGLDSAIKITNRSKTSMMRMLSLEFGEGIAKDIFNKAQGTSELIQFGAASIIDFFSPGPMQIPKGGLANYRENFGTLSSCKCAHCNSMYSAAAYMVDLLQFLKNAPENDPENGEGINLMNRLVDRRPDIVNLKLNCDNANTLIPYIDIVNEILELAIFPPPFPESEPAFVFYQTEGSSAEEKARLRAMPQHENRYANKLLKEAVFPWILPFSLEVENLKLYEDYLGLDLPEIKTLFSKPLKEIVRFHWGLGDNFYELIITKETDDIKLGKIWGYPSIQAFNFSILSVLERTGLSYEELEDLLATDYIKESGLLINNNGEPCKIEAHTLNKRQLEEPLDRLHRFIRLKKVLGYAINTLDKLLTALVQKDIKEETLDLIYQVEQLGMHLRLRPEEVLALNKSKLQAKWGMTEIELTYLISLLPTPAPGKLIVSDLGDLDMLIDHFQLIKKFSIDLFELRYLLTDQNTTPAAFGPSGNDLEVLMEGLLAALKKVDSLPLGDIPVFPNERPEDIKIIEQIEKERKIYFLRLTALEEAVFQYFSIQTSLDKEYLGFLLGSEADEDGIRIRGILRNFSEPLRPAIHGFINLYRNATSPTLAELDNAKRVFLRLFKTVRWITLLSISKSELEKGEDLKGRRLILPDWNVLPIRLSSQTGTVLPAPFIGYQNWMRLKLLQREMPKGDNDILDYLLRAGITTLEGINLMLAEGTGWDMDPFTEQNNNAIQILQSGFNDYNIEAFRKIETYERLLDAITLLRKYKINPAQLVSLGTMALEDLGNLLSAIALSANSENLLSFYSSITSMQDHLREKKRDALVAYLLHNKPLAVVALEEELRDVLTKPFPWETPDDIYAFYLIDVQMGSCQLTSRIVQANGAIQQFVQRLLLNLEWGITLTDPEESDHWKQWEWMKYYRVWEANRKVFLYPENWIEPDLRDNKSPFFMDLENELLQGEVNKVNVEKAYSTYFAKLHEVARLDVRGLYEEEYIDIDGNPEKILHVVARTYSSPYIYYYRKRPTNLIWTPWRKIELSIEGDHVIPVVHNGKLMLIWAIFRREETQWKVKGSVSIYWSTLENENWDAPRNKADDNYTIEVNKYGIYGAISSKRVAIYSKVIDNNLNIFLHYYVPLVNPNDSLNFTKYIWDDCNNLLSLDKENTIYWSRMNPDQSDFEGNYLNILNTSLSPLRGRNFTKAELNIFTGFSQNLLDLELKDEDLDEMTIKDIYNDNMSLLRNNYHEISLLEVHKNYKVSLPHQDQFFSLSRPFVSNIDNRSYLVSPIKVRELINLKRIRFFLDIEKYRFEHFYHPYICTIIESFNKAGINGLLNAPPNNFQLHRQIYKEGQSYLPNRELQDRFGDIAFAGYRPTDGVWRNPDDQYNNGLPYEEFDFSITGSYSLYNWELFFHIPLLIAGRLSKNQQFEEADRWYRYIFNPTDISIYSAPAKYWQIKPLFEFAKSFDGSIETLEDLMKRILPGSDLEKQVEAWRIDPFNPHLIARGRLTAYMKNVFQKYMDNLMAWGDYLFAHDTMETVQEALQIYVLASNILGLRPIKLDGREPEAKTYLEALESIDAFSNFLVDIETSTPILLDNRTSTTGRETPPNLVHYFCIPSNDKLLGYWDKVEDRLFKIRHCMNLEGQVRQLALFSPPIDPALLVRARAMGLDLGRVIAGISEVRLPHYRYAYMSQKAIEFCNEVRGLGSALLAALEKKDAEGLSMLRFGHEIAMLNLVKMIKDQQIQEAEETLEGLRISLNSAQKRFDFYSENALEFQSGSEKTQVSNLKEAHTAEMVGQGFKLAASIAHMLPQITPDLPPKVTWGGINIGNSLDAFASISNMVAAQLTFDASMAGIQAGHERRRDDWNLQADLANTEINQIDKQILGAQIRLQIANLDKANHEKQIEQSREVEAYMRYKFTNEQLYSWMSGQIAGMHYQAYQMAYELCVKAERTAKFDLGKMDDASFNYIRPGNFDSLRKGLLAGDMLIQDLRRLELAYINANRREMELTKHISILSLNPIAIIELKETGKCEVDLPEEIFDLDFPGHYFRRIKSVSISLPCIAGPYTTLPCTLRLDKNTIRISNDLHPSYAKSDTLTTPDARFSTNYLPVSSIATSSAQNDSGLFELNFRDERFLPFEGAGVISTWRLELFCKEVDNDGKARALRQFDYSTISDVIFHVKYTAREADGTFKNSAIDNLTTVFSKINQNNLSASNVASSIEDKSTNESEITSFFSQILNLRQQFPSEWHSFQQALPSDRRVITIKLKKEHFPFKDQMHSLQIDKIEFLLKGAEKENYHLFFKGSGVEVVEQKVFVELQHFQQKEASITLDLSVNDTASWHIDVSKSSGNIKANEIQDIIIVIGYGYKK